MSVVVVNPGSEPIAPGTPIIVTVSFTSNGTSATEPTKVSATLQEPGNPATKATITFSKVSLGVWKWEGTKAKPGRYYINGIGEGVSGFKATFLIAEEAE